MFAKSTVAVAIFASFVAAQSGGTTANSTIDPNSIDATMRSQWCSGEINTCGTLCSGTPTENDCDSTSLNFTCTCANGSTPGLQYYENTMPTFICEAIYSACIKAGENDQAAQAVCNANEKANCGHLNPNNFTGTAVTSSSSSSSTAATATAASSASSAASSSTSKAAAATMLAMGREYGSGVVAVGVAAAFGLMI